MNTEKAIEQMLKKHFGFMLTVNTKFEVKSFNDLDIEIYSEKHFNKETSFAIYIVTSYEQKNISKHFWGAIFDWKSGESGYYAELAITPSDDNMEWFCVKDNTNMNIERFIEKIDKGIDELISLKRTVITNPNLEQDAEKLLKDGFWLETEDIWNN